MVPFKEKDYVYVPQGLAHRWQLDGPSLLMTIEARLRALDKG